MFVFAQKNNDSFGQGFLLNIATPKPSGKSVGMAHS
jgi:hypothetical protein